MSDMDELRKLQKDIDLIKKRNSRVEREKAWETSWTRRLYIIITTYVVIALVFAVLQLEKPLVNAIIPSVAFFVSTTSLNIIKEWWLKRN